MRRIVLLTVAALAAALPAASAARAQDRIDRLTTAQLKREAVKVATHGGILCHTPGQGAGCATWYMRRLTAELVQRTMIPSAWPWAECVAGDHESGFNPAAVSPTGDHGVGQINYVTHTWIDRARIAYPSRASPTGWASDVLYSVALFARVSDHGRYQSPWNHPDC